MVESSDDELTTLQRRRRPVVIVNTGDGKGKTTAACGLALRAWAQGWSVGVYQFVKSGKWHAGERAALEALGRLHEQTGEGGPVVWESLGTGRTGLRSQADADPEGLARAGWARVRELLAVQAHDLYVLDEFNHVLRRGWVDPSEVVDVLAARPGTQHVVITGRGAPPELVDAADIVTEMVKVRHVFDTGQRGQAGIEW
ncbi:cob(I)yrinic acid a,c-diamide adenosyltransferase [Brooklawnia cerclae]|uniref:Cob(I)alamin adenosyltransferase n=1 Tax=Brooklawnia cerclae TaxID=349934 RepID=A0ABX0SIT0_9ACTN|nr:cob(I)yrinic acid a,c-diamide adenosyltransferase [Brooklawnia cerclae]NIH58309.1 cob(I)alamin adenosyltransferase [Brooklawnia cerclae]